jgi:hypothetical protein
MFAPHKIIISFAKCKKQMGYVQGVSIPYHHQNTQDPSTQIALSIIMMNKNEANWSTFLKPLKLGKN